MDTETKSGKPLSKRKQKQLVPTELGTAVIALLKEKFPKIVDTKFTAGMEADLDRVGNGDIDYIKMLDDFYPELKKQVDMAREDMRGEKIRLEQDVPDIECELCGAKMIIKTGRYGRFLGCSNYPQCKNVKPLILAKGMCPECGGDIIEKRTKKGYLFYGCSAYPKCNFVSWDAPTGETCPACGKAMFRRKGGKPYCANPTCSESKANSSKKKSK